MPIQIYGREFDTDSLLDVELHCFRVGLSIEGGGLGRAGHFKRIVTAIWDDFIWYEWAHEQAEAICENKVTGFTSGASSGKSDMLARYALVSWYANPTDTLVIVCSTTSTDARQRVWGSLVKFHRQARAKKCSVGNLIETQMIIRLSEKTDGMATSDNNSICLVAAGNEDKDNALKRLQGRKAGNVTLILDELQDCSPTIIDAALWNLSANANFEVHAAGNASSRFDPHGTFLTPREGWSSVNRTTRKWPIKVGLMEGIGMHFDATAEDSPNMARFANGMPQLPFLRQAQDSIGARSLLGDQNPVFLRQFVGWWPDKDEESNYIVTDAALASHNAYDKPVWKNGYVNIVGIDPSYSSGGDMFILAILRYGLSVEDVWIIECHEAIQIRAKPLPNETKDFAAIRKCREICAERDISTRNIGIDSSAGTPMLSIAHQMWSPDILGVQFGGSASELPVSQTDKRVAKDLYANRTSELACVFVEFLNAGQIRGVQPDHAKQLTARKYELAAGGKIKIESKTDFKLRCGYSPDIKDAFNIGFAVLRERLHVKAGAGTPQAASSGGNWKELAAKRSVSTATDSGAARAKSAGQQALHDAQAAKSGLMRLAKLLHRQ